MGLLDPNSQEYHDTLQGLLIAPSQPASNPAGYRREGDYGTRNKYDTYRRPSRQGVASFDTPPPQPTMAQAEQVLGSIFGDWGGGANYQPMQMQQNSFNYERRPFDFSQASRQQPNYEVQPFVNPWKV